MLDRLFDFLFKDENDPRYQQNRHYYTGDSHFSNNRNSGFI